MITVVGLGRDKYDITLRGVEAICHAEKVVVKTALTPSFQYFEDNAVNCEVLDEIYENAEDFTDLDGKIVEHFENLLKEFDDICYCVTGSGYADNSVKALEEKFDVRIIGGVGYYVTALEKYPTTDYTILSGHYFTDKRVINVNKRIPLIITEIDNKNLASNIKLWLSKLYGDEEDVVVFFGNKEKKIKVYELDRLSEYSFSTSLIILPTDIQNRKGFDFTDLLEIMYRLRDKDGCSWDKAQTHESIRKNLIEESYELVSAINDEDIENMIEETGDVLLQAVFHSVIGEQTGEYDVYEVLGGLCNKLLTRHTHIFGNDKATTAEEALGFWEKAKGKEKEYVSNADKMNRLPDEFPSLLYAEKVQKYANKAGFDFENIDGAIEKAKEELAELKNATTESEREMEAGDLLFSIANIVRLYGVSGEVALDRSNKKFVKRFTLMEKMIKGDKKDIKNLTIEELDRYYVKAKEELNEDR